MLSFIAPTIYKKDIAETIRSVRKELSEVTLGTYAEADRQFATWDIKSKEIKRLIPTFNALVKKRQGNIITTIHWTLVNIKKMADGIESYIDKNFTDTTVSSVLTYRKGQYLQFIDAMKFYDEYSRMFLNYFIVCETAEHDTGTTIAKSITPAEVKKVINGFSNFCNLTSVFGNDVGSVMRLLEQVPDIIIIPENIEMVESANGKAKMDPLRMGFISANRNPFYAIMTKIALRHHQKYEKAKEERDLLRLRLLNLQRTVEGYPDPAVQKEIAHYENRIAKLTFQIDKVEEEYA